jgi:multidrug efflux pump subunit AcrA (membrane-fusion protein)
LSQQDDDVALAALKAAADGVTSAENNVSATTSALEHWTVLASYEQVRSPIDGTVTARNVEVGSLVSSVGAGEGLTPTATSLQSNSGGPPTGGAQGGELFQIANMHSLRTFVSVPEEYAMSVQTGQEATLTFSEMPGQQFHGKIIRSSDSLSQQTRTLLLEVQIKDPKERLRPGMFASVQLHFNVQNPGILISGDSVIPRAQGQFVAVVDNNIVHLQQVHVGRDLGTQLYVTTGLRNGDQIVVNPTDSVQEGVRVQTKPAPKGQER